MLDIQVYSLFIGSYGVCSLDDYVTVYVSEQLARVLLDRKEGAAGRFSPEKSGGRTSPSTAQSAQTATDSTGSALPSPSQRTPPYAE